MVYISRSGYNEELRRDLEDIKALANKSEYEKITEPLERRISELEAKIYEKDKKLTALYVVCRDFLRNNIKNYEICLPIDKPHLRWPDSDEEIEELKFVRIRITDEDILKEFYERLAEVHKDIHEYRV